MAEPSLEELYAAWVGGDLDAGRRLIARRLGVIRKFMRTLLPESEQDDAIQEVFARLSERAQAGGEVRSVKGFTAGIARNVARDRIRKRAKSPVDLSEASIADLRPDIAIDMVRREEERLLLKGLHRLPVDDQILLSLRYWDRLTTKELASILELNHSTVRTKLQRAEARLRKLLHELADSPQAAEDTIGSFSGWARATRERVDER